MAKQLIDIGTSANKGDGDPLRTAFGKINDNFNELYDANFADPGALESSIIPGTNATYDLGSSTNRWSDLHVNDFIYLNGQRVEVTVSGAILINGSAAREVKDTVGSVFGDDSTLLIDGINSSVNLDGTVKGNIIPDADVAYDLGSADKRFRDLYLSGSTIDLGGTTLSIVGGQLQIGGTDIKDVVTAAGVDYSEIQNTPTIPTALSELANDLDWAAIVGLAIQNNGLPVLPTQTLDINGSVFADDSTLLVDGVNGRLLGPLLTNSIASPETGNLELEVGRENGGTFSVTAWADKNDLENGWKQILWGYDTDHYEFFVGGDIYAQGSIATNDVTASGLIARQGQYLYVTSAHAGGSATNVAFIYDTDNNRPRQTFYGKTEFGNNGAAPIVDFDGVTIENWTDPNVVNRHTEGSAWITIGISEATIDNLTVRIANDGLNQIEVQFNYDPDATVDVSASGDAENSIGLVTLAPGNTSWIPVNLITMVGTTKTFTVTDHGFHKVYRGTVVSHAMPDGGPTVGDAYCILERLL